MISRALRHAVLLTLIGASPGFAACRSENIEDAHYVICEFDSRKNRIALLLKSASGDNLGDFDSASAELAQRGETLLFAMNAGMYHADRSPVGLFIADGVVVKKANSRDGPGNFHLKPNGVFFISKTQAGVMETGAFLSQNLKPDIATQSGPMLVINNAIHPRFLKDSSSRKRRNGVGVAGHRVVFALADTPVTFHAFARLFRDTLQTPNALYLDGSISRLYAPELARNDVGAAMGPILAVTAPLSVPDQGR